MEYFIPGILFLLNLWVFWADAESQLSLLSRVPGSGKGPYPLYMMHLYRTLLAGDGRKPTGAPTTGLGYEHPSLHNSDSVLSLVAKSE